MLCDALLRGFDAREPEMKVINAIVLGGVLLISPSTAFSAATEQARPADISYTNNQNA